MQGSTAHSLGVRMVTATGIVSLAARMQGWGALAAALFGLNVAAWLLLCVLSMLRLALHPRRVLADLVDHLRGPGFFTLVAGTTVRLPLQDRSSMTSGR